MDRIQLYVSVPIAGFRVVRSREYWDTYPCPPPSTVYGMLLSLVGETDRFVYKGTEIAISLLSKPSRSCVLRNRWRMKNRKLGFGQVENACPGFQEFLSDVRLSVWVRKGKDEKSVSLCEKLASAINCPSSVSRFGGLSLGESTHLVNEIRFWRNNDPTEGRLLLKDDCGNLSLPIWPDYKTTYDTCWGQFRLSDFEKLDFRDNTSLQGGIDPWIKIEKC